LQIGLSFLFNSCIYRVAQIKRHFTFLLVTNKCIDKILIFLHINYIKQQYETVLTIKIITLCQRLFGRGRYKPEYFLCIIQGGPKNGPFLNVGNFAMVSGRKACYVKSLQILSRKKYKTCIAVCLNIFCLICINIHYP